LPSHRRRATGGPIQQRAAVCSSSSYLTENGLPSRWHRNCTAWRPEYRHGDTPPPGITHRPAMVKPARQVLLEDVGPIAVHLGIAAGREARQPSPDDDERVFRHVSTLQSLTALGIVPRPARPRKSARGRRRGDCWRSPLECCCPLRPTGIGRSRHQAAGSADPAGAGPHRWREGGRAFLGSPPFSMSPRWLPETAVGRGSVLSIQPALTSGLFLSPL
jgi:hypothetical protein